VGSISGTLYIGMTGNLNKRAFEHKFHRVDGFTDKYDVERLLYWESYDDVQSNWARETAEGLAARKENRTYRIHEPAMAGFKQRVVPMDERL
jgi:putative endonuclease